MVLRKVVAVFNGLVVGYGSGLTVVGDEGSAATSAIDGGNKARVDVMSFWALGLVLAWAFMFSPLLFIVFIVYVDSRSLCVGWSHKLIS